MIRLFDLEVYVTLEKLHSFSKTGKKLGITQSSVTQVIQKLEDTLDTRLINRSSKSFTLTSGGKILLEAARDILARFAACKQSLAKLNAEEAMKLRVSVSTTPGEYILPQFFSEFSKIAPDIRLIVEMGDSKRALENLEAGECQAAIVGSIFGTAGEPFTVLPLLKERLVVIASKNVKLGRGGVLSLETIKGLTRIDREEGSGTRQEAGDFIPVLEGRMRSLYPGYEPRTMQLQSVQAILTAVSDSDDLYSIVGHYPAKRFVDLGSINLVTIEGLPLDANRTICVVYRKEDKSDILANFIASVKKYFEMQALWN